MSTLRSHQRRARANLERLEKERAERQKRREVEHTERLVLRARLEKQHGTADCAVADALWDISWERGHSSGYYEVEQEYDELAERLVCPLLRSGG